MTAAGGWRQERRTFQTDGYFLPEQEKALLPGGGKIESEDLTLI